MKFIVAFAFATYLLISCDPPRDMYQQGIFTIPVTVVDPKDSINLGDSICFIFDIPDTITINGSHIHPFYGNDDGVSITLEVSKMDTTLGGETMGFTQDCAVYAAPGNVQGRSGLIIGRTGNNKLFSKYYLIPKKKGVYFLSNPQPGYFSINNEGIKGRVLYTIDVPDKHHTLLINTARPQNRASFQAFIQAEEAKGQPVYGFAVR